MNRSVLLLVLMLSASASAQSQEDAEDPSSHPCPLKGLKDGKLTLTDTGVELFDGTRRVASAKTAGFTFNPGKGHVECAESLITLSSQAPYSAATQTVKLTLKGRALQVGTVKTEDASADALEAAERGLKAGNIEAALEQLDDMMYPTHYYNPAAMAARVLQRAQEVATQRFKAHDAAGAAKVMQVAFEHFASSGEALEGSETLSAERLTALRNDYGYFLDEAGRHAEAEKELRQVVEAAPDRAVARLNLGDALWAQDKKQEAEAQYREYAKRIPRKKWPSTLATRCPDCAPTP